MSDERFLSRWSRRKSASNAGAAGPDVVPAEPAPVVVKPGAGTEAALPAVADSPATPAEPLPSVESLTPESDFTPFMKAEVDPGLKRQAFKKLIEDPRFNVMDGLDVYIDDYSKPDPLPEGWLEKMNQVKHLGIFKPAAELAEDDVEKKVEPLEKTIAEQPLVGADPPEPADTFREEILPSEVGKCEVSRGGV